MNAYVTCEDLFAHQGRSNEEKYCPKPSTSEKRTMNKLKDIQGYGTN